jgi:hypothetical protein
LTNPNRKPQLSVFRESDRPTVSYQLCATPYSAVAFAESRDSLGNSIYFVWAAGLIPARIAQPMQAGKQNLK